MNAWPAFVSLFFAWAASDAPPTLDALVKEPESYGLGASALAIAREFRPEVDVPAYLLRLDAMAREVAPALRSAETPEARLRVLAEYLYRRKGYGNRDEVPADVYVGLDEVIDGRQWNCLGLSVLYVALGERLGLPLRVVTGPGHALVAYGDGPYAETTDGGAVHPNLDYLKDYLPYPCAGPDRFRALDRRETLAMLLAQSTAAAFRNAASPRAVALLEKALEINPRDAEGWAALGTALAASNRVEPAIEAFSKAVELDPRLVEARGGLGNALYAAGRLSDAIAAYRGLLEVCAESPKAHYNLGQLLYEAGDLNGSAAAYRRYIAAVPRDPDGYLGLAFPLEDAGDLDGALAAYEKALELNPNNAAARINRGLVRMKKGDPAGAVTEYEAALRIDPRSALAYQALGEALLKLNRPDDAARALARALRLNPNDPDVLQGLGEAHARAGRLDEAEAAYRAAVAAAPDDPDARAGLADVLRRKAGAAAGR